jgi:DNA-binding NarL/FixJ family response regulator
LNFKGGLELGQPLTETQTVIMEHVCNGLSVKQIADELNDTIGHVNYHVRCAYVRLGATKLPQAVARYMERKLKQ